MWLLILPVIAFIVTRALMPVVMNLGRRLGIVGVDIHKPWKPQIPGTGGLGLAIGILVPLIIYTAFYFSIASLAALLSLLIALVLGLIDDLHDISPRLKVFIGVLAGLPIVIFGVYNPRPYVPFLGQLRITILYPILVPIAYAVLINAANMIDTHNGVLPSAITLIICCVIPLQMYLISRGIIDPLAIVLSLIAIGSLLSYLPYNLFPAKVFNGNTGSHFLGALLALITVYSRLEIVMIISIMPIVVNGFSLIISVGGLRKKEQIERPVVVRNDGSIEFSKKSESPITLVQLLTLKGKIYEPEIVLSIVLLMYIFCSLGIVTFLFTYP